MSRPVASRLAWSSWAVNIVVGGLLVAFGSQPAKLSSALPAVLFIVAFVTPGALLASRRPENPIGWLLCASALAFTVGGVTGESSDYAFREHREDLPAVALAAWWEPSYGASASGRSRPSCSCCSRPAGFRRPVGDRWPGSPARGWRCWS